MATHDYVLANQSGSSFRTDLNNALAAVVTNNSSSSEPSTTYAYMLWVDSTNNLVKLRNASNNSWITLFTTAGGVDVDAASHFNEDVTFAGATSSVTWDKSADDLIFNDNAKAIFGTSSDGLEIFHDGDDNYIKDTGTGGLYLSTNQFLVRNAAFDENHIQATENNTVELYYDGGTNDPKLKTTTTGVQIEDELTVGANDDNVAKIEVVYSSVPAYITNSYDGTSGESTFSNNIARTSDGSASWGSFSNSSYGAGAIQLLSTTSGSQASFFTAAAANTNPTERFRINPSGVVQVVSERLTLGTSLTAGGANDGNFCIEFSSASRNAVKLRDTHNTGSTTYMVLVGGSVTVGSITGTTGAASFNNLSDYRSKENDVEITDGITKLKLLRPIRFNYKTDSSTLCDGFFAHEVTPAVPTAVTGVKDAVDSEGKINPQMLDASKLVPLITAALKEAIAKIETLETKVAALEG